MFLEDEIVTIGFIKIHLGVFKPQGGGAEIFKFPLLSLYYHISLDKL